MLFRSTYLVLFVLGTARAFSQPAMQSILPTIVPTHHFSNGVAWSSSAHQLSVVIGPVIAGWLLLWGAEVVFVAVAAGSYGFSPSEGDDVIVAFALPKARSGTGN